MKLYHFTFNTNLESISRTGLRAYPLRCGGLDEDNVKLQRGVWLTECEHTRMSPEASLANFKFMGQWHTHWMFDDAMLEEHHKHKKVVRLTINIGDNDRRLIRFAGSALVPHLSHISSRHWVYLRTITPDKITDVDLEQRHAAPDAVSA